jgi:DNA anti-recombination protein RmuC
MIEQKDVDELLAELESMRASLVRDREEVRPRLEQMVARAKQMRTKAAGGKFEASVTSVHGLLESLHAGVTAQSKLNKNCA